MSRSAHADGARNAPNAAAPRGILKGSADAASAATLSSSGGASTMPDATDFPAGGPSAADVAALAASLSASLPSGVSEGPDAARLEWLWAEYERQQADAKAYQEEGIDIFPTPGFVAKTLLLSPPSDVGPHFPVLTAAQRVPGKTKFFVNLCADPAIAMPSMAVDGDGNEVLRVPVSVGPVRVETLGSGSGSGSGDGDADGGTAKECLAVDVVFSPDSLAKAQREREFRGFLAGFAVQKIEQKYHVALAGGQAASQGAYGQPLAAPAEIKFPKMRFKGAPGAQPEPQHVRRPRSAHVEDVTDEPEDADAPENIERRRQDAQIARIEALRRAEQQDGSGLRMPGDTDAAAGAGAADVFLSADARDAAHAAQLDVLGGASNSSGAAGAAANGTSAPRSNRKIEVVHSAPAAPSAPSVAGQTATPASAAAAAAAAAPTAPAAPSLPAHAIFYLKASADSSVPAVAVPASEWDMDLSEGGDAETDGAAGALLPQAVQVRITLPLVDKSSAELDVDISAEAVSICSNAASVAAAKHAYALRMAFPFLIDADTSTCSFKKKTRELTLTLPVTERKPLPDIAPDAVPTPSAAIAKRPAVDWKARLGLENSLMYRLVSE